MRTTVLMVDDHAGFRIRARVFLEAEGYQVVGEASSGSDAIVAAERLRPDLAIIDIGLPDLDGFAVASRLRAAGLARWIVLVSGRDREDYGARLDTSDADAFIPKADLSAQRLAGVLR
ncbi:MAG: response regulator transcription factor [Chloroflexi bacterium]|nr:response regulator transcription factor [Chloroflexota bacterium]